MQHAALLLAVLQIGMLMPTGAAARADAAGSQDVDGASIRDFWSSLDAAWNARDAQTFSRHYTDDVTFAFVDRNQSFSGRAEVHGNFAQQFPRMAADLRHRTSVREARLIATDVVGIDGLVEVLRVAAEDDASPTVFRSFDIYAVMVRSGGEWQVDVMRIHQRPDDS